MEPCIKDRSFVFDGNTQIDASLTFVTDEYTISRGYAFGIIADMQGLDADPLLIVQGSNNKIDWTNPYSIINDAETGDVTEIKTLLTGATDPDGVNSVKDQLAFPYRYIRVSYDANGVTTGTIEFTIAFVNI